MTEQSSEESDKIAVINLPKLGMLMEEGEVTQWLVAIGDRVEVGSPIVLIGTEKVENEVVATCAGTVTGIYVEEGAVVPVFTKLCTILSD